MGHILETIHQIWDDSSDERIEVGPDRDGVGLIEALGLLMQRKKNGVTP